MRNLAAIDENKDLVTKEYVDGKDTPFPFDITDPDIDLSTTPGTARYDQTLRGLDANGDIIWAVDSVHDTSGAHGFQLNSFGGNNQNSLQMLMKPDGTASMWISQPAVWRNALGAAASSHNHSASNITSGVLSEARGGTGASSFKNAIDGWAFDTAESSVGDYGAMWLEDDDTVHVGGSLPASYGGVPSGGSTGQVLTKMSSGYAWQHPSGGGGDATPTGTISMFAGSTAPTGYLLCQGQAVSRTTYSALFSVIGTTYGSGNGSTTFNLPNLQGKFALGKSSSHALASTGGAETVTLSTNEIPAHTHGNKSLVGSLVAYAWDDGRSDGIISSSVNSKNSGYYSGYNIGHIQYQVDASHEHDSVGGGASHNNMPPYQTVNYIIKT